MKRSEVKAIFPDATDEQLKQIMDLNGDDIESAKAKTAAAEAEYEKLKTELETLKSESKDAADFKAKYEQLQKDIAEKDAKAKAEAEAKEKSAKIEARFNAVIGDKKFTHEAIKAEYLKKFGEALGSDEYAEKGDADIIHALTKDDKAAFAGVTPVKLVGGAQKSMNQIDKDEFKKMTYAEKAELYRNDPAKYEELKGH